MATASDKNSSDYFPPIRDGDVKILVIGDPECGKTTFINVLYDEFGSGPIRSKEKLILYQCSYELMGKDRTVYVFEIDGSETGARLHLKKHSDSNSFVVMYAIDDPLTFQQLQTKWINRLWTYGMLDRSESVIVVGNKMDLRGNEQVIQRLAQYGQSPITEDQGKSLVDNQRIRNYYDCSSLHSTDVVKEAWKTILSYGYADVIGEVRGYHNTGSNDEDPPDD